MIATAEISACGTYRWMLTRHWEPALPAMPIIALNPSTADWQINDPTIIRDMGFARRENFGGIAKGNLFALRSTDPAVLCRHPDPVGDRNRTFLRELAEQSIREGTYVVCAWGAHPFARSFADEITAMLRDLGATLMCFGTTKSGFPCHPLYLRKDTPLVPYLT